MKELRLTLSEEEYYKLKLFKKDLGLTWKQMLLSVLNE
jgi:hypothetical protein